MNTTTKIVATAKKTPLELAEIARQAWHEASLRYFVMHQQDGDDNTVIGYYLASNDDHTIWYDVFEKNLYLADAIDLYIGECDVDSWALDEIDDAIDPKLVDEAQAAFFKLKLSPTAPEWLRQLCTTDSRDEVEAFAKNTLFEAGMAANDVLATAEEWKELNLARLRAHAIGLAVG